MSASFDCAIRGRPILGILAATSLTACTVPHLQPTQRAQLEAWLTCEECTAGEIDSVRAMGDDAVDFLAERLRGPERQAIELMRTNSGVVWSRLSNPATDSAAYVNRLVSNFQATVQKRAAVGLGAIGTTASIDALREVLADHDMGLMSFRPDVLAAIHDAVYLGTGNVEWGAASAGSDHSCGVATNGQAFCWGRSGNGRLGLGTVGTAPVLVATPVASGTPFDSVSADSTHTCGLTRDQRPYCWGDGSVGQLGYGGTDDRLRPVPVVASVPFVAVYAGGGHFSCGLADGGDVYCWGDNRFGQLGVSPGVESVDTPAPVTGGLTFTSLSLSRGGTHACGVVAGGGAYCWGTGAEGELGTGASFSPTPEPVRGPLLTAVDAGYRHSCGISAGSVFCWGSGDDGRLGNGSNLQSPTAVPIGPVSSAGPTPTFVSVSAGYRHSCAVTAAGAAYCWGYGLDGQLGNGESGIRNTPVLVVGGHLWRTVAAADHSCGITVDNLLYCWGPGGFGEIGDSGIDNRFEPTPVTFPPAR